MRLTPCLAKSLSRVLNPANFGIKPLDSVIGLGIGHEQGGSNACGVKTGVVVERCVRDLQVRVAHVGAVGRRLDGWFVLERNIEPAHCQLRRKD